MKPFKANFILGKKQIILASLVLILGVAVYLNWQFATTDNDLSLQTTLDESGAMKETLTQDITPEGVVIDETGAVVHQVESEDESVVTTQEATDVEVATDETQVKEKNLGDALLVTSKSIADETYFAMAKYSRTR